MRVFSHFASILLLAVILSSCSLSSDAVLSEVEQYNGVVDSTVDSYKGGLAKYLENKDEFMEYVTKGVKSETLKIPNGFSFPDNVNAVLGKLPYPTPAYEGYFTAYGFNGVRALFLFTGGDYKYRVESVWTAEGLEVLEVEVR